MATTGGRSSERGCFLCALDVRRCARSVVEGMLLAASAAPRPAGAPTVTLRVAQGDPLSLALPEHARPLVRELALLPPARLRALRLRALHLGAADEPGHDGLCSLRAGEAAAVVLEPDLLLNITDLNNAEFCARQYALRRMIPSAPTEATLRGTIVHQAFKELLKSGQTNPRPHVARAVRAAATDLALRRVSAAQMTEAATTHLDALARWYATTQAGLWCQAEAIRAETFRLAPEVGLKGRLDIVRDMANGEAFLELKSGATQAELPKRAHRWQVQGYQALLAVRRPGRAQGAATLLYSGTPGAAQSFGIPFSLRDLHRVLDLRNRLALLHATGRVPSPPGPSRCGRCSLRAECARASALLGWEPPPVDGGTSAPQAGDAAFFAESYEQLRLEARAAERATALLWQQCAEDRAEAGAAIAGLALADEPRQTASGEWEYTFRCEQTSELREGDPVLVSDGDPIAGEVVSGTILEIGEHGVTVWTPERIARPALIDRYGSETVHDRTLRNLWRWLEIEDLAPASGSPGGRPRLRALVAGEVVPTFDARREAEALAEIPERFNEEQRLAIARALAARDYLLIQGPPGTGKTAVVAEIARRAMARGERVLLAAFTNQAVDTVLRRLVGKGVRDVLRLGHALSVAEDLRTWRWGAHGDVPAGKDGEMAATTSPEDLLFALRRAPCVAATTATWSAERYDAAGDALRFDLALVDEATQLTVPSVLGALRFARRFILVGDERQLPPLVMSDEAAERGLGRSLFAALLARWGARASVALTRQYRMHPIICGLPSRLFYDGKLRTDGPAREALLEMDQTSGHELPMGGPLGLVLDPARPLIFVDVADSEAGKASRAQARVAGQIVVALRRAGIAAERVGVIAPYRAHVAAVRQRLAALGERAVQVDTVDRFQGAEREVIVFATGGGAGAMARGQEFLGDPHRLNVALTRAQRKLIVLGSRATFARVPPLAALVDYCAGLYGGRGGIITARQGVR